MHVLAELPDEVTSPTVSQSTIVLAGETKLVPSNVSLKSLSPGTEHRLILKKSHNANLTLRVRLWLWLSPSPVSKVKVLTHRIQG